MLHSFYSHGDTSSSPRSPFQLLRSFAITHAMAQRTTEKGKVSLLTTYAALQRTPPKEAHQLSPLSSAVRQPRLHPMAGTFHQRREKGCRKACRRRIIVCLLLCFIPVSLTWGPNFGVWCEKRRVIDIEDFARRGCFGEVPGRYSGNT